jgi:lipocalin-like protein
MCWHVDSRHRRREICSLLALMFLCPMLVPLSVAQEPAADRGRLVGAWRLESLEEQAADGSVHKADASGLFVFTSDSHASVQVMYDNRQNAAQSGPVQYAAGGYEASFGTYRVDERAHTFTFHVEGAMVRNLIGKDLPRVYEFSGKQLIVRSANPAEHWRVVWERY